jgi:hypothetical protein
MRWKPHSSFRRLRTVRSQWTVGETKRSTRGSRGLVSEWPFEPYQPAGQPARPSVSQPFSHSVIQPIAPVAPSFNFQPQSNPHRQTSPKHCVPLTSLWPPWHASIPEVAKRKIAEYDAGMHASRVVHFAVDNKSHRRLLTHFYLFIHFADLRMNKQHVRFVRR